MPQDEQRKPDWFCPRCGHTLRVVPKDDEWWGQFCEGYRKDHETEWFLCTNENCVYKDCPLVLHHPVYGWDKPAGDSWAIGYVK